MTNEKEQLKDKILSIEPLKEEVTKEEEELLTDLKSKVISLVDEVHISDTPVLPQFVIDFIEESKEKNKKRSEMIYDFIYVKKGNKQKEWLNENGGKNFYKFALACEIGYEPQRYTVDFTEEERLFAFVDDEEKITKVTVKHILEKPEGNEKFKFTEKQIKEYNEHYWAFAKEAQNEELQR